MKIDYEYLFDDKNEKPLDRITPNGGFARIFRDIAVIGDSMSSGEFETVNENGSHGYFDYFEFSWGQYMARAMGSKVYNFSRGGMTSRYYLQSFGDEKGFWNRDINVQAYIFAMGCNDLNPAVNIPFGSFDDVDFNNWRNNNINTYVGGYTAIIQRYKEIQPRAKFFLITMPKGAPDPADDEARRNQRDFLYSLREKFDNIYVIDLYEYGPEYNEEFQSKFYMNGHLNPMGYALTGDMVMSYIDFIVRHNMNDFKDMGFIGKGVL